MALKISSKGSVRIPAKLRKRYNLRAGSKVVIVDYGGMLAIVPAIEDPIKKGYGFLKGEFSMADDLNEIGNLRSKEIYGLPMVEK